MDSSVEPPKNPEKIIGKLAEAAKKIEYFVDKIPNKSIGGLFYSMVTLFLLCLFAVLVILAVINLGRLFPLKYQWVVAPIIMIIIGGLLLFFIHLATSKKED